MENLPLQIRKIDIVEIDNSNRAHTRRSEIHCGRRSEATRADAQDARRFQASLTVRRDFGHHEMARITLQFCRAQLHRIAAFVLDDASLHLVCRLLLEKKNFCAEPDTFSSAH